ncbi:MAG: hypothetical protein AAGA54_00725 [Myxococcota bacterium]
MRRSTVCGLLACASLLAGCQETPSYSVRWRVADRPGIDAAPTPEPQDEVMTNPIACSRNGVSLVELAIFDSLGEFVDFIDRPCFPEAFRNGRAAINGNVLSPGDYTAIMWGTRASGATWGTCLPDDDVTDDFDGLCDGVNGLSFIAEALRQNFELCEDGVCPGGLLTCECKSFSVRADRTTRIPDFTLDAPPDCEDGIDSDGDGLVDQLDPGCQVADLESTPVLTPELLLSLSVLSGNPNANCGSIRVGRLGLTIDGEALDPIDCNVGRTRFSFPLAAGPHTFGVVGLAAPQNVEAATVEKTIEFTVSQSGVATPREFEVDFRDIDLVEPLEAVGSFTYGFELPDELLEVPEGEDPPTQTFVDCNDPLLDDKTLSIRALGPSGVALDPPLLTMGGQALDASCSAAAVITETVRWGTYLIEVEATNEDGDVCWTNAGSPEALIPSEAVAVLLDPAEDAPASCFGLE